jgi:hypothetical protein
MSNLDRLSQLSFGFSSSYLPFAGTHTPTIPVVILQGTLESSGLLEELMQNEL